MSTGCGQSRGGGQARARQQVTRVQAVDVGLSRAAERGSAGDERAERGDADRDAGLAERVVRTGRDRPLCARAPSPARRR